MKVSTESCAHHWGLEPPNGPESRGVCRVCGEERMFPNWDRRTGRSVGSEWGWRHRGRVAEVEMDHFKVQG
jgi:hypothetical protein